MRAPTEDPTKTRQSAALPRLLVFFEGGAHTHDLRGEARLVIGRGDECDVRIATSSVSRKHALLTGKGPYTIEDLGSSNGTFVGGRRLERGEVATLRAGDVIGVGDARLVLDLPEAPTFVADEGETDAMHRVHRVIELVADSPLSVLILGETGAGKGRLAEEIHARSSRRDKPLVRLNCAAVPEALLESELFGHERGAFTGAVQTKTGILEAADGGTVFLDEIGDVARSTQAKLLHVLEHGEVMRVGGVKPRPIDVRFIAATNRELLASVEAGHFRRDLYFRLAGVPILIPPLRERTGEIPAMVHAFVKEVCDRSSRRVPTISDATLSRLVGHSWPGNIRELRNVAMRAALMCNGNVILPEHIVFDTIAAGDAPLFVAPAVAPAAPPVVHGGVGPGAPTVPPPPTARRLDGEVKEFERVRITEALDKFAGHQGKAAEHLGISRRTLTNKLNELGLPRPRKK